MATLHGMLDEDYGVDGAERLRDLLKRETDLGRTWGALEETALHVATRRRRLDAVEILLEAGADIEVRNAGHKTCYAHAIRRGFTEIADRLRERGASTDLDDADRLAVAVVDGKYDDARTLLQQQPGLARTGNPEEDRLLADIAGRFETEPVRLLLDAGADLTAPGLDHGTPLHQAAWFGQPENARLLIDAGAPLDLFDATHASSPVGWAVHGSRYSGGAKERESVYVELVRMLLRAGSRLHYPDDPQGDAYRRRLLTDASPAVRDVLRTAR
ncbi:MAG: ankyrin repeat domain-containing protein [Acidobacteriota bacterium]|nr:ankyrin repeat domain-containing protein [Acidobacteriota bacterium]MDH3784181.1 ankyrin repeat domain-containing protein [Acidobacteriota bacterium]